jgi:hypothetical protein
MTRADVDEVNVHVIDRCYELRQGVEFGLGLSPVVVRSPITHRILEFRELFALRPIIDRLSVWPSRRQHASAEIDELLLRYVDAERTDGIACGRGGQGFGQPYKYQELRTRISAQQF